MLALAAVQLKSLQRETVCAAQFLNNTVFTRGSGTLMASHCGTDTESYHLGWKLQQLVAPCSCLWH
jgi:hypothetical protein